MSKRQFPYEGAAALEAGADVQACDSAPETHHIVTVADMRAIVAHFDGAIAALDERLSRTEAELASTQDALRRSDEALKSALSARDKRDLERSDAFESMQWQMSRFAHQLLNHRLLTRP